MTNQQLTKSGKKLEKGKKQDGSGTGDSKELDLSIPPDLEKIIDDDEDYMPLRFNDDHELMEIFSTLEE